MIDAVMAKEVVEGTKSMADKIPDFSKGHGKDILSFKENNIGNKVPDFLKKTNETTTNKSVFEHNTGLTEDEKLKIKNETGWSDEIIDHIENMDQYEIYKNADLIETEINGRKCLIKANLDLDYVDPKTGLTNKELMEKGRSPVDSKTGEKIELHHMNQKYDSPFVELTASEHGGNNHKILHTSEAESWRSDPELKNKYNNTDRPDHWRERANRGQ